MVSFFVVLAVPVTMRSAPVQTEEKRSVDGLIFDLKHPEKKRRKEAAELLGRNEVRQAVPALIEATNDPEDSVRLAAVRALVSINDTRALQAYISRTQDPKKEIQKAAIEGLIKMYTVEEGGFVEGVKKVVGFFNPLSDDYNPLVVEPYMPVSESAVSALADLLDFRDKDLRKDAARALGILRGHSALRSIEEHLKKEDSDSVKVELIRAIFKIGDPSAGPTLIPFINDSDKKVHDEAILTLGRLDVEEAVPPLNELYRSGVEERRKVFGIIPASGSDDLQKKVLEALAYIGDARSKDIFVNSLEHGDSYYRRYGAEGLGRMGDSSYETLLAKKYLREESSSAKLAMSYALFLLGREEHLEELVLNSTSGDQAHFYLLEFQPEQVEKLHYHAKTEKDPIKIRLLDVIGRRGDASSIPVAQELSRSKNVEVAAAANLALRRLQARTG